MKSKKNNTLYVRILYLHENMVILLIINNNHTTFAKSSAAILIFLMYGCVIQSKVKTSDTHGSSEKIRIFSEPPQKAYEVISFINASIFIDDFTSPKDAENAALKKLKNQAQKIGADGIIEVYLELSNRKGLL